MEDYDVSSEAAGFFRSRENAVVVTKNKGGSINKSTFMHELTHKAMSVLFQNLECNPYKNSEQREEYRAVLKEVLINIRNYIKDQNKFDVQFKENINPRQMGKQLADT